MGSDDAEAARASLELVVLSRLLGRDAALDLDGLPRGWRAVAKRELDERWSQGPHGEERGILERDLNRGARRYARVRRVGFLAAVAANIGTVGRDVSSGCVPLRGRRSRVRADRRAEPRATGDQDGADNQRRRRRVHSRAAFHFTPAHFVQDYTGLRGRRVRKVGAARAAPRQLGPRASCAILPPCANEPSLGWWA